MTDPPTRRPHRARRWAAVLGACALAAALVPTTASASTAPDDPRVGLPVDAEASSNVQRLSNSPLPAGSAVNSDLAFKGDYTFSGNYNGFNIYDVSRAEAPRLVTSYLCPGSQNDVSVHGDLLFLSVEQTTARVDCSGPTSTAEVFRGVRIFDISDVTAPRLVANVQTCRGSHTHTLVEDPDDRENLYVYVSGTAGVRPATQLAGCDAGPATNENPSRWRIDVIKVPLGAPATASVVGGPRLFTDPGTGRIDGLQNQPQSPNHPSGSPWGPRPETDACHDITAYPELGLAAGACEGNGILVDIRDPENPRRITEVSDPNFAYWHSATFNNDGTKVVFTDEWGGGSGARCRETDRPEWGANAIFDIVRSEGRTTLRFASYYKLPAPQSVTENCVAHNGSLVPVPGRDVMVQAWYQGGLSVIDFTDSKNPKEIGYFDRGPLSATSLVLGGLWSAYWHNGIVHGNEIARGFDTFALTPSSSLSTAAVAAARGVRLDGDNNVQLQKRIVWPASFTTVRGWLDSATVLGELRPPFARTVSRLIDDAERDAERGQVIAARARLKVAAGLLGRSSVERGLRGALDDLGRELRRG